MEPSNYELKENVGYVITGDGLLAHTSFPVMESFRKKPIFP
jgi:hypothetical protein